MSRHGWRLHGKGCPCNVCCSRRCKWKERRTGAEAAALATIAEQTPAAPAPAEQVTAQAQQSTALPQSPGICSMLQPSVEGTPTARSRRSSASWLGVMTKEAARQLGLPTAGLPSAKEQAASEAEQLARAEAESVAAATGDTSARAVAAASEADAAGPEPAAQAVVESDTAAQQQGRAPEAAVAQQQEQAAVQGTAAEASNSASAGVPAVLSGKTKRGKQASWQTLTSSTAHCVMIAG